jgi:hypothetical protein
MDGGPYHITTTGAGRTALRRQSGTLWKPIYLEISRIYRNPVSHLYSADCKAVISIVAQFDTSQKKPKSRLYGHIVFLLQSDPTVPRMK